MEKLEEIYHSNKVIVAKQGLNFLIVGVSGYRAILPECGCERTPCAIKTNRHGQHRRAKGQGSVWHRHAYTHCHGWHQEKAVRFGKTVEKTYVT